MTRLESPSPMTDMSYSGIDIASDAMFCLGASDGIRVPFAMLPDGRLTDVASLPTPTPAGLVCPDCRQPVTPVRGEKGRTFHFRHRSKIECLRAGETALHLFAKKILAETLKIWLPEVRANGEYTPGRRIPEGYFRFDSVELEVPQGDIVPDVVACKGDRRLYIEFCVTHAIDREKLEKIRRRGVSTVEIDLSSVPREMNRRDWAQAILRTANRTFVFNAWSAQRSAEIREKERQEGEEAAARRREIVRSIPGVFERTPRDMTPDEVEFVDKQRSRVARIRMAWPEVPNLVDERIFDIPSDLWQALILDRWILPIGGPIIQKVGPALTPSTLMSFLHEQGATKPELLGLDWSIFEDASGEHGSFNPPEHSISVLLHHLEAQGFLNTLGEPEPPYPSYRIRSQDHKRPARWIRANHLRHRLNDVELLEAALAKIGPLHEEVAGTPPRLVSDPRAPWSEARELWLQRPSSQVMSNTELSQTRRSLEATVARLSPPYPLLSYEASADFLLDEEKLTARREALRDEEKSQREARLLEIAGRLLGDAVEELCREPMLKRSQSLVGLARDSRAGFEDARAKLERMVRGINALSYWEAHILSLLGAEGLAAFQRARHYDGALSMRNAVRLEAASEHDVQHWISEEQARRQEQAEIERRAHEAREAREYRLRQELTAYDTTWSEMFLRSPHPDLSGRRPLECCGSDADLSACLSFIARLRQSGRLGRP